MDYGAGFSVENCIKYEHLGSSKKYLVLLASSYTINIAKHVFL